MAAEFLISRLSALGDVVCSLPAASALKRAYPDCQITWAVDPRFAGIVECCRSVDHVLRVKPGFSPSTWPQFERRFDVALDLQGLLKSALVVGRAKADRKFGYHWQREGSWLFSQRVLPDPTSFHIVDQYVDVARAAGGVADKAQFALAPLEEDLVSVREKLSAAGVAAPFVVMNAGAGWATKRWPAAHFARVIDTLASDGIHSVLIGGKAAADVEAANEVVALCASKPASLLGQTSVRELVALLSLADAHLGGDTGSTHIMGALGRPAIGLYSITRPQRSCPYGQVENCLYSPDSLSKIEPAEALALLRAATAAL
jgi:heptosyltransferase I